MALRALLFSSDGSATSVLCEILTDLHIEAEICSEMLVAVERMSRESYDAIVVDWDQETEATFLLKTAREQKAPQALNLALVQNDKNVGSALQQGANSVIKKPINLQQANDTLSTARDLILLRRAEKKQTEARIAAVQAEVTAAAEEFVDHEPSAPKTGFLSQTAPRSAFEAQTKSETPAASHQLFGWQAARGPEALREDSAQVQEIRTVEKKLSDEPKPLAKAYEPAGGPAVPESEDATGVFSSLLQEEGDKVAETQSEPRPKPHSQRLGFVLVACSLVAGVLYVWAPGDSYGGRLASLRGLFSSSTSVSGGGAAAQTAPATAEPEQGASDKTEDPVDSAPLVTTDVDPSKIQIIETKTIPKAGAQIPTPAADHAASSDPVPGQPDTVPANTASATETSPPAPTLQTSARVPPQTRSQVPVTLTPVVQSRPLVPMPVSTSDPATPDARTGVIIPDSLKTLPSPAPASSLEPSAVSEDISRDLVIQRVEPDYPAQALQQHLEGPVVLQAWVSKDGSIQDLKLVKGYFILGRAAFAAVKQWRFKPYSPNGKSIDFQTYITVTFKYPG